MADLLQEFMYMKEGMGIILSNIYEINKKLDSLNNKIQQSSNANKITQSEVKALKESLEEKANPYRIPAGRGDYSGEWCSADGTNRHTGGGFGGGSSDESIRVGSSRTDINDGDTIESYKPQKPRDISRIEDDYKPVKTKLDIQKTIKIAKENVYTTEDARYGKGHCATKVRETLEKSTGETMARPESGYAKDYAIGLESVGFEEVHSVPQGKGYPADDGFAPEPGDVVVIEKTSTSKEGHTAIYGGKNEKDEDVWYSDFIQKRGAYPGDMYRKEKPSYKIYRHKNRTNS